MLRCQYGVTRCVIARDSTLIGGFTLCVRSLREGLFSR